MAGLCRLVSIAIIIVLVLEVTEGIAIFGHSKGVKTEATKDMDVLVRISISSRFHFYLLLERLAFRQECCILQPTAGRISRNQITED